MQKFEKPCPICDKKESEIFPEDYNSKFLVKCSHCGNFYIEQTIDEKTNLDEHAFFKKIESNEERKALSKWIRDNQDSDNPPFVKEEMRTV